MQFIRAQFTVFFADPFWVGVYERQCQGRLEVCKITFGPEPKDGEVQEYLMANWRTLRFSPSLPSARPTERHINPKRKQREAKRQLQQEGVGTKAQQAIALQREEGKRTRKSASRAQKEEEKVRKHTLRQEKKKQKHRGH